MPSTPSSRASSRNLSPTRADQPSQTRASSFLGFPVRQVVNSTIRRLGADPLSRNSAANTRNDENSQSNSQASSAHASSTNLASLLPSFNPSSLTASFAPPAELSPTPPRSTSPFQPPPLTPLVLSGYKSSTPQSAQLLGALLAEEVRLLIPPRIQIAAEWKLVFSLEQDGASLSTLYSRCSDIEGVTGISGAGVARGGCVLVIRDAGGNTFGAYLTDPPHTSNGHYYGHGESFLWKASRLPSLPAICSLPLPPSEDTTHAIRMTTVGQPKPPKLQRSSGAASHQNSEAIVRFQRFSTAPNDFRIGSLQSAPDPPDSNPGTNGLLGGSGPTSGATTPPSGVQTPDRVRFKAFPYSGENDYLIFCEPGFLSVGGGDGHYGLWLDDSLEHGISQTCPTFGNEPLSDDHDTGCKFDVVGVEVWWVGSS